MSKLDTLYTKAMDAAASPPAQPRAKWFREDTDRYSSSKLAFDEWDEESLGSVHPQWGPSTRTTSPPSWWKAFLGDKDLGRFKGANEAKAAVMAEYKKR